MASLRRTRLLLHRALIAVVASGLASLEASRGDETVPRLDRDVLPILNAIPKCHSPLVSKGKLNLSSARSLAGAKWPRDRTGQTRRQHALGAGFG